MKYKFKLNGKVVSLNDFAQVMHSIEQNDENEISELFETGSVLAVDVFDEGNADVVLSIEHSPDLNKNTLKLATFATLSVLNEDTPDGLPDKYIPIFRKLGDELQYEDLVYDDIVDELIKELEVKA